MQKRKKAEELTRNLIIFRANRFNFLKVTVQKLKRFIFNDRIKVKFVYADITKILGNDTL